MCLSLDDRAAQGINELLVFATLVPDAAAALGIIIVLVSRIDTSVFDDYVISASGIGICR